MQDCCLGGSARHPQTFTLPPGFKCGPCRSLFLELPAPAATVQSIFLPQTKIFFYPSSLACCFPPANLLFVVVGESSSKVHRPNRRPADL